MKQNSMSESGATVDSLDRRKFVMNALEEFERPLTRYAQRMFGSQSRDSLEEARDAVQHTFLKLCEQPPDSIAPKIGPWLYAVCRNRVIDQIRRTGKVTEKWPPPLDLIDQRVGPDKQAEKTEFSQRLNELIGQLSGMEREVIELWSQGFNHREISEVLDKTPQATRVGLHRGLKKLKNHPEVCSWLERATSHERHPVAALKGRPTSKSSTTEVGALQEQSVIIKGEQS